jgi:YVTN family beta-propeller protein
LPISPDRAIVTQWGMDLLSGSIALVDLNNNTVIQKISQGIGKGPEQMLKFNDKVYIANVGGLDFDNFISVIDIATKQVIDTIQTPDAPNSIQFANNLLWVACSGKTIYAN